MRDRPIDPQTCTEADGLKGSETATRWGIGSSFSLIISLLMSAYDRIPIIPAQRNVWQSNEKWIDMLKRPDIQMRFNLTFTHSHERRNRQPFDTLHAYFVFPNIQRTKFCAIPSYEWRYMAAKWWIRHNGKWALMQISITGLMVCWILCNLVEVFFRLFQCFFFLFVKWLGDEK